MNTIVTGVLWLSLASSAGPGFDPDALRRHVELLASDELGGRNTGEPGIRRAERYIARRLESAGLRPLPGERDFFLDFDLYRERYDLRRSRIVVRTGGARIRGRLGDDYAPFGFSSTGSTEASVVFAGYGIVAEEAGWDDYRGLDVEGKWVLVLRHAPREGDTENPFPADGSHAFFRAKADRARERGAAGMLLVTDPLHHEGEEDLSPSSRLSLEPSRRATRDGEESFLALHVSRRIAEALVRPTGETLVDLQRAMDGGEAPASFPLRDVTAKAAVHEARRAGRVPARNVAGFLAGRDPRLADEWVVIGAHHDHVGSIRGTGDTVHNGADDNASGVAAVLELARRFADSETPRRSMVFMTFSAEERGLLGSRTAVRELPVGKIAFMVNLDMIGRNPDRALTVYGDGFSPGTRQTVEEANRAVGLELRFTGGAEIDNSDHASFYARDVPYLFFFSGLHDDYHGLGDHADKLAYDRMASVVALVGATAREIANRDERPRLVHHVSWLGAELLAEEAGLRVRAVDPGSRADLAGIAAGDLVRRVDDTTDPERLGRRLREASTGGETTLGVSRGGEERPVAVRRVPRGYLGVAPGPVPAEIDRDPDEGFALRRVTPDGPADRAGLRRGDVVLRIGGLAATADNLRSRLERFGEGATVEFTVLRDGERLVLPVELGARPEGP